MNEIAKCIRNNEIEGLRVLLGNPNRLASKLLVATLDGRSALMVAVLEKNIEALQLILNAMENFNDETKIQLLSEDGAYYGPLFEYALKYSSAKIFKVIAEFIEKNFKEIPLDPLLDYSWGKTNLSFLNKQDAWDQDSLAKLSSTLDVINKASPSPAKSVERFLVNNLDRIIKLSSDSSQVPIEAQEKIVKAISKLDPPQQDNLFKLYRYPQNNKYAGVTPQNLTQLTMMIGFIKNLTPDRQQFILRNVAEIRLEKNKLDQAEIELFLKRISELQVDFKDKQNVIIKILGKKGVFENDTAFREFWKNQLEQQLQKLEKISKDEPLQHLYQQLKSSFDSYVKSNQTEGELESFQNTFKRTIHSAKKEGLLKGASATSIIITFGLILSVIGIFYLAYKAGKNTALNRSRLVPSHLEETLNVLQDIASKARNQKGDLPPGDEDLRKNTSSKDDSSQNRPSAPPDPRKNLQQPRYYEDLLGDDDSPQNRPSAPPDPRYADLFGNTSSKDDSSQKEPSTPPDPGKNLPPSYKSIFGNTSPKDDSSQEEPSAPPNPRNTPKK